MLSETHQSQKDQYRGSKSNHRRDLEWSKLSRQEVTARDVEREGWGAIAVQVLIQEDLTSF